MVIDLGAILARQREEEQLAAARKEGTQKDDDDEKVRDEGTTRRRRDGGKRDDGMEMEHGAAADEEEMRARERLEAFYGLDRIARSQSQQKSTSFSSSSSSSFYGGVGGRYYRQFGEVDEETKFAALAAASAAEKMSDTFASDNPPPTSSQMAAMMGPTRDRGPGYVLDTPWKTFSSARERQRAMLRAGWFPLVGSSGSTTPHIRWGRKLPGAVKQSLTFSCTPSDARHWMNEQSNLLRQDRDARDRLAEIGLTDAMDAGMTLDWTGARD